jgi:4-amino-4-deoxy-L-arabinose transferase-like glycosyltransferase
MNAEDFNNTLALYQSHPPLSKYAIALTIQLFTPSLGFLYAARVAGVAALAALLAAVYLFVRALRGRMEALLAVAFLFVMPRVFANSLFAVQDSLTTLLWFAAAALFYLAMENRKLAWVAGLAAGLAMATKINGLMLPLVLWPWGLYFHRKRALPAIIWSAILMPVVFFALWPFLWVAPIINTGKYFGEKFAFVVSLYRLFGVDLTTEGDAASRMMIRSSVWVRYFKTLYPNGPPWHYAVVMTVITTPVTVVAAAAGGAVRWFRERSERAFIAFLAWNVAFWLILFSCGLSKPYDGVRLFLCVFPFVAILAALGAAWAWRSLAALGAPRWAATAALAVYVALSSVGLLRYGAFGQSYYNCCVGGLAGADKIGFDVTFWGETIDAEMLRHLEKIAPPGSRVAAYPMGRLYVHNTIAFGLLGAELRPVEESEDWDFLIIANRGAYLSQRPDLKILTHDAAVVATVRGVPGAWIVERKR